MILTLIGGGIYFAFVGIITFPIIKNIMKTFQ